MQKRHALVAGGAGFLGSNLAKKLLSDGWKVTILDNLSTGKEENLKEIAGSPELSFMRGDVTKMPELGEDFSRIYNLASPASPPHYQKDPVGTWSANTLGTFHLLELAEKIGARFLQASTSEVYGDPMESPQKESYWGNVNPIGIRSCYDESKRAAESVVMDFNRQKGADVRIIRIFNTYGPMMDPSDGRVVSNFIVQALRNEPITIYGDGSQTRSFQYVDDLILGMVRMMETDGFTGPVNLGNPVEFTMNDLARTVLSLIPESKSTLAYHPLPQDDPRRRLPDITLAKERLGWEPKVSLEEGLMRTIEYFRKKLA